MDGQFAYLSEPTDSLRVVDITDPVHPLSRGTCCESAYSCNIFAADGYVYVPKVVGGWDVVSVLDPDHPAVIATYPAMSSACDVWTDGDTLYAAFDDRLEVYDITDRTHFAQILTYHTPGHPHALRKHGSELCVADQASLLILRHAQSDAVKPRAETPSGIALMQNYPNPFNSATTLSYTLDRACLVDLTVYDLLGRHTATLVSGTQLAGEHRAIWNGEDFASGIYFATLKAGQKTKTVKMILLK